MGHWRFKGQRNKGPFLGTCSLFEGMGYFCLHLASSEGRMLWALSQRFWQCSWGSGGYGTGDRSPEVKEPELQPLTLGKLSCSPISRVETLIILVPSFKD